MATDGTDVWVANPSRGSVTEFAAATGALVRVVRSAKDGLNFPGGIATNGTDVWVANTYGRSVTELSVRTGELVHVIEGTGFGFFSPSSIAADPRHVWVVSGPTGAVTELSGRLGGSYASSAESSLVSRTPMRSSPTARTCGWPTP